MIDVFLLLKSTDSNVKKFFHCSSDNRLLFFFRNLSELYYSSFVEANVGYRRVAFRNCGSAFIFKNNY